MKIKSSQISDKISVKKADKNIPVLNPNIHSIVNADKIFSHLSFGAAIAQAQLQIQSKKNTEKSEIDDAVSSILSDIEKGQLKLKPGNIEDYEKMYEDMLKILDKYLSSDEKYLTHKKNDEREKISQDFWDLVHASNSAINFTDAGKIYSYINRGFYKYIYTLEELKDLSRPNSEKFSIDILSNFKKNIAPKLSQDELYAAEYILCDASNNKQTRKEAASFDYTLLSKRRLTSFISAEDIHNKRFRVNFFKEFLFCNDEEFKEKISKLNKRMFLKQTLNSGSIPFITWKQLLDMNDADYERIIVPRQERQTENFDADKYRENIEAKIKEPLQFDADKVNNLIQNSFSLPGSSKYTFDKRFDFKKFESKEDESPLLPSADSLMKNLKSAGRISFEIQNKGRANPVNTERAEIKKEDEAKLGKTEDSGIKIQYGKQQEWSNFKIARDIMQNFYDGNGHTLEGVKLNIIKTGSEYKIRIEGLGSYDYSHLFSIGSSEKSSDYSAAGYFGEGTRILAVNLLSKLDTNYVKYGSGGWSVEFNRSSDDIKTADMTQTLTKNKERINGNYIEFNTKNKELVKTILESKDYFYHPDNPDFKNFDYENEFFGIKFLPNKNLKILNIPKKRYGNLYLIQRYEHDGKKTDSLKNLRAVFKKMPNDPELVKLNGGETYNPDTGRDRAEISNGALSGLFSRYLKTMKDEDLAKLICTLEPYYNRETAEQYQNSAAGLLLNAAVTEACQRHIGINFENYVCMQDNDEDTKEAAKIAGCKTALAGMDAAGMPGSVKGKEKTPFEKPDEAAARKIRLLNEAVRVLAECADLKTIDIINPNEADTPKYPYTIKGSDNIQAEAIIQNGLYKGHWVKDSVFKDGQHSPFYSMLGTWLHELSHKAGGDGTEEFAEQLKKIQQFIMNSLVRNPEALNKIKILAELYDGKKQPKAANFNEKEYKAEIKAELAETSVYKEFAETPSKDKSNTVYKKREKAITNAPVSILPDTDTLIRTLNSKGRISFEIPNKGGINPVNTEKAEIKKEDEAKLKKTENAGIKIQYGKSTNWSNFKIARDIMQNFYDGNGHTLEGVKLNIIKTGGKYKIRIEGLGIYDYSHIKSLGASTKNDDFAAAGNYGEGTRITAVNLLSKLDTNYVKYASGDWAVEFNRSSDDIKTADMTQTLTKNKERINGNYIEFDTENEELVKTILDSKDYFYHPDNPDFKNLDFENEYFGFRVQKNPGNIYYIQRYQTPDGKVSGGMDGINIVFKKNQKAVNEYLENHKAERSALKGISGRLGRLFSKNHPAGRLTVTEASKRAVKKVMHRLSAETDGYSRIGDGNINTGRDRNKLEPRDIYRLALKYAKTMTDDELISAIENCETLFTCSNADLKIDKENPSKAFILGIMREAANRNIKFSSKDAKIAWVSDSRNDYVPDNISSYLKEKGYKFGPEVYSQIGIKSAEEVYNEEHKKHSVKPSEKEAQKLKILNKALQLFKPHFFKYDAMDWLSWNKLDALSKNLLYIYEKGEDENNRNYHAVYNDGRFQALMIDRSTFEKDNFMETLSRILAELPREKDNFGWDYTYALTDIIRLELYKFINNPETAQKLKVLENLYEQL